jgi:hypothetical protein
LLLKIMIQPGFFWIPKSTHGPRNQEGNKETNKRPTAYGSKMVFIFLSWTSLLSSPCKGETSPHIISARYGELQMLTSPREPDFVACFASWIWRTPYTILSLPVKL